MSAQRKASINFLVVAIVIATVIALCVAFPHTSERPVSTRLCLVVVGAIVLCVFLRTFNRGLTVTQRVYLVEGAIVLPAVKPELGDPSPFFSPVNPADISASTCSICLCSTTNKDSSSNCCQNSFHKKCLRQYWKSINTIRCPNCRFTLTPLVTV